MPSKRRFEMKVTDGEWILWQASARERGATIQGLVRILVNQGLGHERQIGKRGRKPAAEAPVGDGSLATAWDSGTILGEGIKAEGYVAEADAMHGERHESMVVAGGNSSVGAVKSKYKIHADCTSSKCRRLAFPCCSLCWQVNRR